MANLEQLEILKQGVGVWNKWRYNNLSIDVNFMAADLNGAHLNDAFLSRANLVKVHLREANLIRADLAGANLDEADLAHADLTLANLAGANLDGANLKNANLGRADLSKTNLAGANLNGANLGGASLNMANFKATQMKGSTFLKADVNDTIFRDVDLSEVLGLEDAIHHGPSIISISTFILSKGKLPGAFLQGCGLPDWEIEVVKLHNPNLNNQAINELLYKIYDLRATQALQISPLFVSYSHADTEFVDKVDEHLTQRGIRYWRDTHELKSGRMERQIDRAIELNPIVLLILSKHSLKSDWVEHEVRKARQIEKKLKRDVLCPVALDNSWKKKNTLWPQRIMEQIMEYNILDFSEWRDDSKFSDMFRKLIDGLELFYKK